MRYTTVLKLNNRVGYDCITNAQEMHKAIQSLFDTDRESSDALYVIKEINNSIMVRLQSNKIPNVSRNKTFSSALNKVVETETEFEVGEEKTFSYLVEPQVCKGNRVYERYGTHYPDSKRYEWLSIVGNHNGFELVNVNCTKEKRINVTKGNHTFYIQPYNFYGKLRVTDTEKFKDFLEKGHGKHKAYGVGYLFVA